MRNILLIMLVVGAGYMVACDKHDRLDPVTAATIFNVTSAMSHNKDTVKSGGDTIIITARGGINDTLKPYAITASIRAIDSVNTSIVYAAEYIKTLAVTYDTSGYANTKLFRWTGVITLPLPPITAKSKFKANATFTYGLNTSSQIGNATGVDSKFVYAK